MRLALNAGVLCLLLVLAAAPSHASTDSNLSRIASALERVARALERAESKGCR